MALAIIADVPMLRPMARLITVKVTGKVKLIAASGVVPNILIKKVSTRLKVIRVNMPARTGIVIFRSVVPILPCNI